MPKRSTDALPLSPAHRLAWKMGVAISCRLVLNTARRFAYPFAPVLSRGLGVPLTAVTSLIAVNQATAILGMFFGPLADRLGYRLMMLAGLAMLTAGMFAGGLYRFTALSSYHFFWPDWEKVFLIRLFRRMSVNGCPTTEGGWLLDFLSLVGQAAHL